MDDLEKTLETTEIREDSGSTSFNAQEYQRACAVDLIIEYAKKGNDFLALIEFHDDILFILKDEDNKLVFYQVKTTNFGYFTKSDVKSDNWIGKIIEEFEKFPSFKSKGVILTNNGLKIDEYQIDNLFEESFFERIFDCKPHLIEEFKENVETYLEKTIDKETLKKISFKKSVLNLNDYPSQVEKHLETYINEKYGDISSSMVSAIYSTIDKELTEIQRLSSEDVVSSCEKKLLSKKSISVERFNSIIDSAYKADFISCEKINDYAAKLGVMPPYANSIQLKRTIEDFRLSVIVNSGICKLAFSSCQTIDFCDCKETDIFALIENKLNEIESISTSDIFNRFKYLFVMYCYHFLII